MSNINNGNKNKSINARNNSLVKIRRRNSINIHKRFSPETCFRGFEAPIIRLERINVSRYINNMNTGDIANSSGTLSPCDESINEEHLSRLLHKCSVNLVRDDLDKLLEMLMNKNKTDHQTPQIEFIGMPNLKCSICNKAYLTEKRLQSHQENKHQIVYKPQNGKTPKRVSFSDHIIVHEVQEYHKCRKCTKIFKCYKSLKVHMKLRHKKRKCYICNYCMKKFIDRMFFKVHIRLHCDVCGLLFQNKVKQLEHKRTECRTIKEYKCKTCDETYFTFMDLKDHSYEHFNTYFVCDICKDQFMTKCSVAHHILFLHSDKRPTSLYEMRNLGTDRLYLCNFCEESTVDRDVMEKHVELLPDLSNRAMTGYKDYYFCDQCLKKFDTETDMLQHKWSHYLKTNGDNSEQQEEIARSEIKSTYNVYEKIPEYMQPTVVLEEININLENRDRQTEHVKVIDNKDNNPLSLKKAIVDPVSKKTLLSKHQCQTCGKYYSSSYCLNRHILTLHYDYDDLQCKICEETFVWPSLLQNHNCIRLNLPELQANGDTNGQLDNLTDITPNFDDFSEDYANAVDFEIPAPIVELKEYDGFVSMNGEAKAPKTYPEKKQPDLYRI